MQISDLVGQYSRNVANGTEELHGAQSVQKLVSTIGDLSAGSIFEGTIMSAIRFCSTRFRRRRCLRRTGRL